MMFIYLLIFILITEIYYNKKQLKIVIILIWFMSDYSLIRLTILASMSDQSLGRK